MATELKNIFLSASIPLKERHQKYIDTADIIAIRDAIIALTTVLLPKHRLIWGGHPSITPLINYVMTRKGIDIQNHVRLYQSKFFEAIFPADNNMFENVILTDVIERDLKKSVDHMRARMFGENKFAAAVFIGGMEGIEDEYELFTQKFPDAIMLPIASTGAATKIVYSNRFPDHLKNERLVKDYGYMSLFQDLLMDKL